MKESTVMRSESYSGHSIHDGSKSSSFLKIVRVLIDKYTVARNLRSIHIQGYQAVPNLYKTI